MMRLKCVCLFLTFWLVGCATQPVDVQARFPAVYPAAAELIKIAVFEFEGRDGPSFSNGLTAELKSATLDGQPYFSVLSADVIKARSAVRSTAGSQNFTIAMDYGRRLGVQGVYFGMVNPVDIQSRKWSEERTKCLEYKNIIKCKKEQKYTVYCYEQTASFSIQPKLVNVQTGALAYAGNVSGSVKHEYCKDDGTAKSKTELTAAAHADAIKKIRHDVAPYNGVFKVSIKKDADNLSPADLERFKGALAFSKVGQMDRACAMWQELSAISPESKKNISLNYNLGVCAEVVADYDRAIELYSKADAMLTAPDRLITEARKRAYNMKKNQEGI